MSAHDYPGFVRLLVAAPRPLPANCSWAWSTFDHAAQFDERYTNSLINAGVDINERNASGSTVSPLDWAVCWATDQGSEELARTARTMILAGARSFCSCKVLDRWFRKEVAVYECFAAPDSRLGPLFPRDLQREVYKYAFYLAGAVGPGVTA